MTQSSLHDKGSSQDFYVLCETGRDPTDAVQPLPPLLWIRKDTHFRFWDLAVTQLYTSLSQQHKKQTGRISTAVSERRSTLLFLWKPRSITLLIVTNTVRNGDQTLHFCSYECRQKYIDRFNEQQKLD